MEHSAPERYRMYDPGFEHDACGIGFVARINGTASHDILHLALTALASQEHRGAVAADGRTGDGSGILTQLPLDLLRRDLARAGVAADHTGLAVGMLFLPQDEAAATRSRGIIADELERRGMAVLLWRDVPTDPATLGVGARAAMPQIAQVIVAQPAELDGEAFERLLYLTRKVIEHALTSHQLNAYIPSLSSRTIVYKGMMIGKYLADFYLDLQDPEYETALAVYHERFSTNTFPAWQRAQPFRMVSHNGEINTVQGNHNWIRAREHSLLFPETSGATNGHRASITPVIDPQGSDSAMFDNVLELLVRGGRDIRHAIAMMVPEVWETLPDMDPAVRDFYQYHTCLMEPWDGPAALTFSDGRIVGTTLDRNGLRPARYGVTDDGLVISGSETGVVPVPMERFVQKGRLGPGQMIAVDTGTGQLYVNDEIKRELASRQPYGEWVQQHVVTVAAQAVAHSYEDPAANDKLRSAQQMVFGYTSEELNVILKPMERDGQEPIGSMGDDTPLAVLSQWELGRPLYHFFKQRFAEVTNPPMDPLREELVMSLGVVLGRRGMLLDESPQHAHLLSLPSPFLTDEGLAAIRASNDPALKAETLHALVPASELYVDPEEALRGALEHLCYEAAKAAEGDATLLVISDRGANSDQVPIPALLTLGAVHHHLIRARLRGRVSLIVESGEPRDVHHMACLLGYGAKAINPYLALDTVRSFGAIPDQSIKRTGGRNGNGNAPFDVQAEIARATGNYLKALEKGLRKIMSKMGISPLESYAGAQIFEAVGLDRELVDSAFTGTPSRLGGIGLAKIANDMRTRHVRAYDQPDVLVKLPHPGFFKFKKTGEAHAFSPQVIHAAHTAAKYENDYNGGRLVDARDTRFLTGYDLYRDYMHLVYQRPPNEIRDLLDFRPARAPISVDEVEPIDAILRRFSTAAMSLGATSTESHEVLSIAMNRLGGYSNSGEGGEAPERYKDERNSRIKQIASGRFGVTPSYLAHAEELQIKMAQGAKPGEGGQLPGHKVTDEIARIRHTMPGVALISPPPHHDIYSIEDLAQLIYDLKQVNPQAAVSVKLVATAGVGTIAAGVAKAYADTILISGHSGGTGASPLSSIKNVGVSWELGLAETQQTLMINGLRGRVRLRADGGMQCGRDVVIAALLGADEFSFGTLALVAQGCLMARACHSNTCPVGIATQRPDLRAKFPGTPEMVMTFFRFIAQEVREILASLGFRSLDEAVGRTDLLFQKHTGVVGADLLHLDELLLNAGELEGREVCHGGSANTLPDKGSNLNQRIVDDVLPALASATPIVFNYTIRNCDRTVGATLGGAIGAQYGSAGLPDGSVRLTFRGSSGQSFGAFNAPGVHLTLIGEANDYVGKGMAGGTVAVFPDETAPLIWSENVIAGNTILYGATGGMLFLAGRVGERFCVRNSGATVVVEGVGDHGCEYMTGGTVVVLGPTGYNFGAGMTGGVAYVLDEAGTLPRRYNKQLVQLDLLHGDDEARARALIEQHHALTGSPRAAAILADWGRYLPQFVRVMPREAVAKIEAANENTHEVGKKDAAAPVA